MSLIFHKRRFGGYIGLNGYAFGAEIQPDLMYVNSTCGGQVKIPFGICFEREKRIYTFIALWLTVCLMLREAR